MGRKDNGEFKRIGCNLRARLTWNLNSMVVWPTLILKFHELPRAFNHLFHWSHIVGKGTRARSFLSPSALSVGCRWHRRCRSWGDFRVFGSWTGTYSSLMELTDNPRILYLSKENPSFTGHALALALLFQWRRDCHPNIVNARFEVIFLSLSSLVWPWNFSCINIGEGEFEVSPCPTFEYLSSIEAVVSYKNED